MDAVYSDTRQTCHAYKVLTVNYRRKNSTKHLSPKDLFRLLGCTCTCTCIGLSLSSTTPRRVKFMVRSCLWRCDINVEKSNGYTLYISFELFKIFFFYPYLKKNGKGDLVANKALLEDTLIAHFIGFSLTSAEISYIQLYLRYNLFVCLFLFSFFFFTKYSVLHYLFMHVFSQVTQ